MGGDSKYGDTTTLDCKYMDTRTVTMGSIRKAVAIGAGGGRGGRRRYKGRRAVDLFPYLFVGFFTGAGEAGRRQAGGGRGGRTL